MSLGSDQQRSYPPAITADQLPVLPGMSLGEHLQVLHHVSTGLLGVQLVALDQVDRSRVRVHLLVPLSTGRSADPDGRHHLARCLGQVRRFRHPANVVPLGFITRRVTRTPSFGLVTARPAGHSLRRFLDMRGPMPLSSAINLVDRLAEFMEQAHDRGLLHLALTPEAVVIEPDRITEPDAPFQVLDLGLIDAIRGAAPGMELPLPSRWTAPEVLRPGPVDVRADVYSLGALLRTLVKSSEGQLPRPLRELVDRATAARAHKRPATVTAFRAALAAVRDATEDAPTVTPPSELHTSPTPLTMPSPSARPAVPRIQAPPRESDSLDADTLDVIGDRDAPQTGPRAGSRVERRPGWLAWVLLAVIPLAVLALALAAVSWSGVALPGATSAPPAEVSAPR